METKPMLHTIIIWESGFIHLSKILWELQKVFSLIELSSYRWKKESIAKNLSKLYPNRDFTESSEKLKSIGGNNLFVFIGIDKSPQINNKQNTNALKIKKKLREEDGQNYLHISDNEDEAFFNFKAFQDISKNEFVLKKQMPIRYYIKSLDFEINIQTFEKKVFNTVQCAFNILNKYENWAILRNWEGLPKSVTSDIHEDVDILTSDYYRTLTLLNAKPKFKEENRVHFFIETKNRIIPFDIRFLGDNYYDTNWQKLILKNRLFEKKAFYRLNDIDYFWSLLYHAVYHKVQIIDDYRAKLTKLVPVNLKISNEIFKDFNKSKKLLNKYLKSNNFKITKPKDKSVRVKKYNISKVGHTILWYFNFILSLFNRKRTKNLSFINKLSCLNHDFSSAKILKRNVFASGEFIIKIADNKKQFLSINEKQHLENLKQYIFFPKVLDYFETDDKSYLIINRFRGKDLYRKTFYTKKQKEIISRDLLKIVEILKTEKITHFDIRPHNLILTKKHLYLIDFQFSTFWSKNVKTSNIYEEMILETALKNVGGEWRENNCKIEDIDFFASQNILKNYINNSTLLKLKGSVFTVKKRLLRYANYK